MFSAPFPGIATRWKGDPSLAGLKTPETKHTGDTVPVSPGDARPRSRLTAAGGGAGQGRARIAQSASAPPLPKLSPSRLLPSLRPPRAAPANRRLRSGRRHWLRRKGSPPLAAPEGRPGFGRRARGAGRSRGRFRRAVARGASGARPAAGGRCGGGRIPSFGGRSVCLSAGAPAAPGTLGKSRARLLLLLSGQKGGVAGSQPLPRGRSARRSAAGEQSRGHRAGPPQGIPEGPRREEGRQAPTASARRL